jgi:uncharacterized protein (TIGR02594 family)
MIPAKYRWLETLKGRPKNITLALALLGTQEVIGKGSNKTIIDWRDTLNQSGVKISGYTDDDIPWCGLFAAYVTFRRMQNPYEVPKDPLWARNWAKYGKNTTSPSIGDILVFARGNGGHVGFYIGEDQTAYHVIGGNQSNTVSIARIAKNRLIAARTPPYITRPAGALPRHLTATGTLSKNEA